MQFGVNFSKEDNECNLTKAEEECYDPVKRRLGSFLENEQCISMRYSPVESYVGFGSEMLNFPTSKIREQLELEELSNV